RERALLNLREELMMLYSNQTGGGVSDNPGKAKIIKKQIARILTVYNEEQR
ncbi:MAG: 50S ribosomal protein L29, partial [Candidatus Hermodarchaeota archaeon]